MIFANLLIAYILESERNYRFFLNCLFFATFVVVVRLVIKTPFQDFVTRRLGETIAINANTVGYLFSMTGLVALYRFLDAKKWYFGIIFIAFSFLSLFSGSGKMIAILIIGSVLLFFLTRKNLQRSFLSFGIVAFLIISVLYLSMKWEPLYRICGRQIETFFVYPTEGQSGSSTSIRMEMMVRGWEMFKEKPFFGWGYGAFTNVGGFSVYAHNNYIELLVSLGIVGTLWYYLLPLLLLAKGLKMFFMRRMQNGTILSVTLLLVMLVDNLGRVTFNEELPTILLALCYVGVARRDANSGKSLEHIFRKAKEWVSSPRLLVLHMLKWKVARLLSDKTFVTIKYRMSLKKKLDLKNPKTYNEKLQWLKLYDRKEMYTKLVDKYEVREHIANTIGSEYLIPLIGVYDKVDDIDFDSLPDAFVLKPTQTSGDVIICRDKAKLNRDAAIGEMHAWMGKNYYWYDREWPYKDVKPRIVCEQLIETSDGNPPRDYKIFCFDGIPKFAFVASDRGKTTKFDYFDVDWNRIPLIQHYPNSTYDIPKPQQWEKMLSLARVLSAGMPHVRVDFYIDANDTILFGELTFFHFSGFVEFEPEQYDLLLGSWLALPERMTNK
ncbi:ATP-grasp fold amidoligase family protein [Sphaerochaeta pleomorpha]|nr:ATP-grasp fold amidoligase family protein [Sphaerochaeta pleomorpha]